MGFVILCLLCEFLVFVLLSFLCFVLYVTCAQNVISKVIGSLRVSQDATVKQKLQKEQQQSADPEAAVSFKCEHLLRLLNNEEVAKEAAKAQLERIAERGCSFEACWRRRQHQQRPRRLLESVKESQVRLVRFNVDCIVKFVRSRLRQRELARLFLSSSKN
ncbi:MAG: hypothetical protein MHM6MM_006187 [Cercozoa sp. M6MM]